MPSGVKQEILLPKQLIPVNQESAQAIYQVFYSAPGRNRTCDTRFRKPMLYPLSYRGGAGAKGGRKPPGSAGAGNVDRL